MHVLCLNIAWQKSTVARETCARDVRGQKVGQAVVSSQQQQLARVTSLDQGTTPQTPATQQQVLQQTETAHQRQVVSSRAPTFNH